MLSSKNTILFALACILIAVVADIILPATFWFVYIAIVVPVVFLHIYGSVSIRSGFYINAFCSVKTKDKIIAITFDDGPDRETTPAVLDILLKNDVPAAFFCVGEQAHKNPELIKRIDAEGHAIGNHSFSHHSLFDLYSSKRIKKELVQTEDLIYRIIGKRMKLFRPPYGVTNPPVALAVKSLNYTVIGWSLKSKDTVIHKEHRLLKRLKKKLRGGDVVLFHDRGTHLLQVLNDFIYYISDNNYRIVRVDQLLKTEAYA